ncbi:MAG TPA: hypothetical protein VHA11_11575 [Bryobacteraceae bacterium]|nr:hypothetical protein [Bryobacteraceae bacterium]
MNVKVFIGEVVWEGGHTITPSADSLSAVVTALLEREFDAGAAVQVPEGRSKLAALSVDAGQPVNSTDALAQSIAAAVHRSLDERNW